MHKGKWIKNRVRSLLCFYWIYSICPQILSICDEVKLFHICIGEEGIWIRYLGKLWIPQFYSHSDGFVSGFDSFHFYLSLFCICWMYVMRINVLPSANWSSSYWRKRFNWRMALNRRSCLEYSFCNSVAGYELSLGELLPLFFPLENKF